VFRRVREELARGRQAYVIYPLVEESDKVGLRDAQAGRARWQGALRRHRVGLLHGRMKREEKDAVMQAFGEGAIDVLVATVVVEVGIDVPNATVLVVEHAERFGLSQLHQLRGRVGRGPRQSHCVLMYKAPLGELARERLAVLRETNDGFVVAQRDLELRGPGELLGTRQTGLPQYRIANLLRDARLIPEVRKAAGTIEDAYPELAAGLVRRWLGDADRYGKV
jgi:ATP-dependent DNA helicase RecG